MDAIEFIKELNRMCEYYRKDGCRKGDERCPACGHECKNFKSMVYDDFKIVNDVKQWSSEHPQKTMLQDFLEKFPLASLGYEGTPEDICPNGLGYTSESYCKNRPRDCVKCWNRPVEG